MRDKVVEKVVEIFVEYVKEGMDDFIKLDGNMETLKRKISELTSREEDIEMELNRDEVLHGKKRKREVETCLENVKKIKGEVADIKKQHEGQSSLTSVQRVRSRFILGKLVTKKTKEVDEFLAKCRFKDGLTSGPWLEGGKILPRTTPLVGTTAENSRNHVLACLRDTNIRKLGVYGLEGSGKTSIMKCVNNDLQENNDFNNIIWVSVSKALTLKRLQSDIAKAIEIELPLDDDEERRSEKLHDALMRRKKNLLILDNLSKGFSLERIGIPEPDEDNGCKMIVITRLLNVCGFMETQKDIQVEMLSQDEAWELFNKKVDNNVMQSSDIQAIAKQVVDKCNGLPLRIVTVGRQLSKVEDVRVWRNALYNLKFSPTEDLQEGILS